MFAAFWLDPSAKDPNKRVVFCQPFCKKPTTAWAVLRSAVREKKTGGVISGSEEELRALVEKIDQGDQKWPDDQDRMVAQITKMAQQAGLTVIFKQNMEPNGIAQQAAVWSGLTVGSPQIDVESGVRSRIRVPLTGHPVSIDAALQVAAKYGWSVQDYQAALDLPGARITLSRYQTVASRAALEIEYPVSAANLHTKSNPAGYSEEFKFGFDRVNDLFDVMLGPTAKKYRFVLLIKERNNSIVFFGTKPAHTVRHAIEQYCDHLQDKPSSSEPLSSQDSSSADDQSSDPIDEVVRPHVQNCRFWKL
jgi:hypothetical protein